MNPLLPAALLCVALGIGLSTSPTGWRLGLPVFGTAALATSASHLSASLLEPIEIGCLISVIVNAISVYAPFARITALLAGNAGLWLGGLISVTDRVGLLATMALFVPAFWLARILSDRLPIAVKVLSSWLIAIAALALSLQFIHVTPGYKPDHLE